MKDREFENVLIVRTDRIGDVVLTLPMVPTLHAKFPGRKISMLLRSSTQELVDGFTGLDSILKYDDGKTPKGFFTVLSELRERRFGMVFVVHPTFRLALLMLLAGIPIRVGTGYRWYSFLFSRRVFEHRRTAGKHEAEYNLSLLQAIGCNIRSIPSITLSLSQAAKDAAAQEVSRLGIAGGEMLVILHPGSGGSARDWSAQNFGDLARTLNSDGCKVVVTGSALERPLVEEVVRRSNGSAAASAGRLSLKELAAFIGSARLFISNSTGPLHIAAAMGTPVIAFYPPIQECSPLRWGPLTEKRIVFTADNALCERCKGGPCQGNDCMNQITVDQVLRAARNMLSEAETQVKS
ncbi:MAG: glycosyltransferase family 9 protein [Ignavibacteriales bacterium]|nr:glycosyltransferase family 9 protein [Ignavibacteriales bacterium]